GAAGPSRSGSPARALPARASRALPRAAGRPGRRGRARPGRSSGAPRFTRPDPVAGLAELQPAMLQLARELGAFAAALRGLRHAAAVGMEGGIGHGAVDGRDLRLDVREAALDAGELPLDRPELRGQPGAVLGGGAALVPARAAAALGARGSA